MKSDVKATKIFETQPVIQAIKLSGCLGQSQRQEKLFEFLLTESALQRHTDITQYKIAVDILGRSKDFDATSDSIVRVEMHRLRANLKKFNAMSDDYELLIPRASYQVKVQEKGPIKKTVTPVFNPRKILFASAFGGSLFVAGLMTPSLFQSFSSKTKLSQCSTLRPNIIVRNSGSVSEIQTYLDRTIRSSVSQHTSFNYVVSEPLCGKDYAPTYVLDYLLLQNDMQYNVSLTVTSEIPKSQVSFDQITLPLNAPQEDLYFETLKSVNTVVKPYGIIARKALTSEWPNETNRNNFRCLVLMYDSFATDKDKDNEVAVDCLERSMETAQAPLDNYGGLMASYLEQARSYTGLASNAPFEKASEILEAVGDDWVNSAEMVIAKMDYEAQKDDFLPDTLESVISVADSKYNSHAVVTLVAAMHTGFTLGNWEKAKDLSDRVKRFHKDEDGSVYSIDAAYALINSETKDLLETCLKAYSKYSTSSNLIVNACARKANDKDWIERTSSQLNALGIKTQADRANYVGSRNLEPLISEYLLKTNYATTDYATKGSALGH